MSVLSCSQIKDLPHGGSLLSDCRHAHIRPIEQLQMFDKTFRGKRQQKQPQEQQVPRKPDSSRIVLEGWIEKGFIM